MKNGANRVRAPFFGGARLVFGILALTTLVGAGFVTQGVHAASSGTVNASSSSRSAASGKASPSASPDRSANAPSASSPKGSEKVAPTPIHANEAHTDINATSAASPPAYVKGNEEAFPRIRYSDAQISVNDRCPVRHAKLNLRLDPIYVNGRPVGFC